MFKIEADLHTHTISSGHGYSTVDELARTAFQKGIKMIAITEHGPNLPGGPHQYFFGNMNVIPERLYGVRILKGVEANILDGGQLDLDDRLLAKLDFVTAGIHEDTGHRMSCKEDYTRATIETIKNPHVNMITHPANNYYPLDLEKVVKTAGRYNVVMELNASSFDPGKSRGNKDLSVKMCKLAQKYRVPLSLNSDAHFHARVGDISNLYKILQEAEVTEKDVINTSMDKINAFLKKQVFARKSG